MPVRPGRGCGCLLVPAAQRHLADGAMPGLSCSAVVERPEVYRGVARSALCATPCHAHALWRVWGGRSVCGAAVLLHTSLFLSCGWQRPSRCRSPPCSCVSLGLGGGGRVRGGGLPQHVGLSSNSHGFPRRNARSNSGAPKCGRRPSHGVNHTRHNHHHLHASEPYHARPQTPRLLRPRAWTSAGPRRVC